MVKYIVCGVDGEPMGWDKEQFCFAKQSVLLYPGFKKRRAGSWQRFKVTVYPSIDKAVAAIRKSQAYRKRRGYCGNEAYRITPIDL